MNGLSDESLQAQGPWAPEPEEAEPRGRPIAPKTAAREEAAVEEDEEQEVELPSNMHIVEPDREAEKWEKVNERKQSYTLPPRPGRGEVAGEAKSTFHGREERDYQGRPWTSVPTTLRGYDGAECFIPKKCLKKFVGHSKGVQAIELFPKTGHLLLSGSMDGTCKIWDVSRDRNVMRTYSGHHEAVRAININNDGSSFLSSGFDRYVRLWDLETGQATATFSNRKMYYQGGIFYCSNFFVCSIDLNCFVGLCSKILSQRQ